MAPADRTRDYVGYIGYIGYIVVVAMRTVSGNWLIILFLNKWFFITDYLMTRLLISLIL